MASDAASAAAAAPASNAAPVAHSVAHSASSLASQASDIMPALKAITRYARNMEARGSAASGELNDSIRHAHQWASAESASLNEKAFRMLYEQLRQNILCATGCQSDSIAPATTLDAPRAVSCVRRMRKSNA